MQTIFIFVTPGKATTLEARKLLAEAKKHGVARIIVSEHLPKLEETAKRGARSALPDLVLVNAGADLTWDDAAHLKAISDLGVSVFPNANNLAYSISKQLQKEAFDAFDLPTAKWELSPTTEELIDPGVFDRLGTPVVTKPASGGSEGEGVLITSTYDELVVQKQIANAFGYDMLIEELIPHGGQDFRISIHNGVPELPMRRTAQNGLITNASLGAVCEIIDDPSLVNPAQSLALAAAQAVGKLDWAGVDLMPDGRGGLVICEVNGAPGFMHQSAARHQFARIHSECALETSTDWHRIDVKIIEAAVNASHQLRPSD